MQPGWMAWTNPAVTLAAVMARLETSRHALDVASGATASLEMVPEMTRLPGVRSLQADVLADMAQHLSAAIGAGRWLMAGYMVPEMVSLLATGVVEAREAARRSPALLEEQIRAVPAEWQGHVAVARAWLSHSMRALSEAEQLMQMALGPGWSQAVQPRGGRVIPERRGGPAGLSGLPGGTNPTSMSGSTGASGTTGLLGGVVETGGGEDPADNAPVQS